VTSIITNLGGNQHGQFSIITKTQSIDNQKLKKLRDLADREYQNACEAGYSMEDIEDLKVTITRKRLCEMLEEGGVAELEALFGQDYSEIVIRRCQAHGKFINFHTDVSRKTLQVSLNSDGEYEGGRLVFATDGKLVIP
jgi:FAD synthase